MPVSYPPGFDPDATYVTLYRTAEGHIVAVGDLMEKQPVPEGATELSLAEYEAEVEANQAQHAEAAALAEKQAQHAEAAARAEQLADFKAFEALVGEDTARRVSGYDGPWPETDDPARRTARAV